MPSAAILSGEPMGFFLNGNLCHFKYPFGAVAGIGTHKPFFSPKINLFFIALDDQSAHNKVTGEQGKWLMDGCTDILN